MKKYIEVNQLKECRLLDADKIESIFDVKNDEDIVANNIRSQIRSIRDAVETDSKKYSDETFELFEKLEDSLEKDEKSWEDNEDCNDADTINEKDFY